MRYFLITYVVLICFSFQAQAKQGSKLKGGEGEVSKTYILETLRAHLPEKICDPKKKYMRCLKKVSEQNCQKLADKNLNHCIKKQKNVKNNLKAVETVRLSQHVGACVRKKMDRKLKRYKRKECRGK